MRLLLLLWLYLLSGCSLLPTTPVATVRPAQPDIASFTLNGRVAIRHNGTRHSAGMRWVHQPQSDELLLLAPLGQTAARVYRDVSGALLEDGDRRYQADDVESLMQQVLGWHLPLGNLHHWVLGIPSASSPAQIERNNHGQITALYQGGWEVHYLRHADTRPDSLPTRLRLERTDLQIQLLIDEWELP